MDTNKMREQFEAWASGQLIMPVDVIQSCRYDDSYANTVLNIAWRGWAASREAVVVELPKFDEYPASMERDMQQSLRAAIEAHGLKVAP